MGIKRGDWRTENINKSATIHNNRYGAKPASIPNNGQSRSEQHLSSRGKVITADAGSANQDISDYRQQQLNRATTMHGQSNSSSPKIVYSASYLKNQQMKKSASSTVSTGGNTRFGGGRDVIRQAPEVYSPLFQIANLQLPRDRITMNAWNRNFYDTHPLVHNCINLHSTYPIGKINIKCEDQKVQQFFEEQCDQLDIINTLQAIALEYWKLGEKIDGNSLITMSDGSLKPISKIQIGDEVITHLGNKKKVIDRFAKPTDVVIEEHLKIYKIKVEGMPEPLIISGRHPILSTSYDKLECKTPSCSRKNQRILPAINKCSNCKNDNRNVNIEPVFKETNNISTNDILYSSFSKDIVLNDKFTPSNCYNIGLCLAEAKSTENLKSDIYNGELNQLNEDVMYLPSDLQLQFLAGFIDGSGRIDTSNGYIVINALSYNMANQFSIMLKRAGITTTISKNNLKNKERFSKNYKIKVKPNDAFYNFYNLLKSDKKYSLRPTKWSSNRSVIYNNLQTLNIKSIEDITHTFTDNFMYDIEVEDDHSYIANGITIHNCFPYAELDENKGMWNSIMLQNPDYIHIKKSVLGGDPVISMRPDAALQRLVQSNNPADIKLKRQIDKEILYNVKKGNNIPLDNFHISHLYMKSSPYDIHGTSLIVSVYKDLMLYDKLRECHDKETEVLTNVGFIKGTDAIEYKTDSLGNIIDAKVKDNIKVACFNPNTKEIEYHKPTNTHLSHFKGEMYHFNGKKVDVMVTPNHRMWVSRKLSKGWSDWEIKKAKDMSTGTAYRFRSIADWKGVDKEYVNILDKEIPINLYLKVLGFLISEGCVQQTNISVSQNISSLEYKDMRDSINKFAEKIEVNITNNIRTNKRGMSNGKTTLWEGWIYNTKLGEYFSKLIGTNGKCTSHFKRIPRWLMNLPIKRLKVFLQALVAGDGGVQDNTNGKSGFKYYSISKDLCDDVSEVAFKCGFSTNTYPCKNGNGKEYWVTSWTESGRGDFPGVYGNSNYDGANIDKKMYNDLVWCFEVPTSLFVTRRNGKTTIQGNSKFSQADNLVNPITLVKVGGTQEGEFHASSEDLENYRQIFECYDEETEVMTKDGFKSFNEVMTFNKNKDGSYTAEPKSDVEIACFNSNNDQLEYYKPQAASLYNYNGDMIRFKGKKIDVKVTPNHRMWTKEQDYKHNWSKNWGFKTAESMYNGPRKYCIRSELNWEGKKLDTINVLGQDIDINVYLKYLGYLISEGTVDTKHNRVDIYQSTKSLHISNMQRSLKAFANALNKKYFNKERFIHDTKVWTGRIYSKDLAEYFKNTIGFRFNDKYIPRWVLDLSKDKLMILLESLLDGDGSISNRKTCEQFTYYTGSKQLANDVYEIAYKCGFVPYMYANGRSKEDGKNNEYVIKWSTSNIGRYPQLSKRYHITKQFYEGKVWCLTVPTGLFVTRRNGKITIQGNSAQYDKDFKIITHAGVSVERVGASGQIINIDSDVNLILDNILNGLMVPKAIITQEGASFNSASVGLEVLKQRYESFRNMIEQWLIKKIFAPISEIQGFYKYKDGEKKLIVPEIDWNTMILFDMDNYINILNQLVRDNVVSRETLFRSLGLNIQEERRKIREQYINDIILQKETIELQKMSLGALRSIRPDEQIIEQTEDPLPGTVSEEAGIPSMTPGVPGASPMGGPGSIPLSPPTAPGKKPSPGGAGAGFGPSPGPGAGPTPPPPAPGGPTTPGGGATGPGGGLGI